MKKKLRLYVWEGFCPDYTGGLAFAIAENEKEAREMIIKYRGYDTANWGKLTVYSLNKKLAIAVAGGG